MSEERDQNPDNGSNGTGKEGLGEHDQG